MITVMMTYAALLLAGVLSVTKRTSTSRLFALMLAAAAAAEAVAAAPAAGRNHA